MGLFIKNVCFIGATCWLLYIWAIGERMDDLFIAVPLFFVTGFWLSRHGRKKEKLNEAEKEPEVTNSIQPAKEQKDIGFIVLVLVVIGWIVYNYLYDDTRKSHPNYYSGKAHERCLKAARYVADEVALDISADPSIWQLQGYGSANEMVKITYEMSYRRCMD